MSRSFNRLAAMFWRWLLLPAGLVSLGWVVRGEHEARADTAPRRILPAPADLHRTPHAQRVAEHLEWACEVLLGEEARRQPPAHPSDCRTPLHGRTKTGGEGPENGTGTTRGEM